MSNSPLDNLQFTSAEQTGLDNVMQQYRNNPQAFEQHVQKTNPQGYQEIMRIRNSANPKQEALKFAQSRGVPPHILRMFGLM